MTLLYALIGLTLIIIMIHMDGMDDDDPPNGQLIPIPIRVQPNDRR